MITTNQNTDHAQKTAKFGTRLRLAREQMRLSEKDIAARLHLNPSVITQIENEQYESNTPKLFLRGYLRSYARMLHFTDTEIELALNHVELQEPIKPSINITATDENIRSDHPYVRWATSFIVLLLLSLVGTWWYTHTHTSDKNTIAAPADTNTTESSTAPTPTEETPDPKAPILQAPSFTPETGVTPPVPEIPSATAGTSATQNTRADTDISTPPSINKQTSDATSTDATSEDASTETETTNRRAKPKSAHRAAASDDYETEEAGEGEDYPEEEAASRNNTED